jgi:hypothetical protein
MGEEFDPLTTAGSPRVISNRGIVIVMVMLIVIGTIFGFVFGKNRVGFGFLIGGILAFANYFWLERATRVLFEQRTPASSAVLALKYILRYVAIGAVLLLLFFADIVSIPAVIAGLSAFAFAVVIQGLKNIFTSSF